MNTPELRVDTQAIDTPDSVHFVAKGGPRPEQVAESEFDGSPLSLVLLRVGLARELWVGLGEPSKIERDGIRRAAGAAMKHLLKLGATDIALDLGPYTSFAEPAVEGALLASYRYEGLGLPASRRKKSELKRLQVIVPAPELVAVEVAARQAHLVATVINEMRELGNQPGNLLTPAILAEKAAALAAERRLPVRIWTETELKDEGFDGIVAVGQGSAHPARLIQIEYRGGAPNAAPIALIGKAITFDTGGISLKPGLGMDEMKWDKMGGMAVLGTMLAAADLKLPVNLVGLIPAAENMPGPEAYRPGDILTTFDGKTIEVLNTDAEGRIVLVDAIAYARVTHRPTAIIEFSTLTGACVRALGFKRAGLFTAEERLRHLFVRAGDATGELVWPLPIDDEYKEVIQSEIATAKNSSASEGSACSSASFVKLWAEEVPFVHFDIAGTAWTTKPPAYLEGGATGFGVRLMLHALREGI